ncbi:MAG: lysophospholipase [Pseudomonadota bacterium]
MDSRRQSFPLRSTFGFCASFNALNITVALICGAISGLANAGTLGGPMRLQDEGMFFVNGALKHTNTLALIPGTPPKLGQIVVGQMYVHYRVPQVQKSKARKLPIVFVHGGGLTGMTYETTPDGREGWATYFTRQGYTTYVVDFPGRGRAGFDATRADTAKVTQVTQENAWQIFRFGPSYGQVNSGLQFPVDAVAALGAQNVPLAETTLEGGASTNTPNALVALLDRIGPAIVFVHSQSGPMADALVGKRPDLVKAVVNVEGSQAVAPTDAQIEAYKNVPALELFGDFVQQDVNGFAGKPRYDARKMVVNRINSAGGKAQIVQLPEVGISGNSHMMMQDKNNLKVADFIGTWILKNIR